MIRRPPRSPLFPYAPLSRSDAAFPATGIRAVHDAGLLTATVAQRYGGPGAGLADTVAILKALGKGDPSVALISAMTLFRSEEHTSELQSHLNLVCRLLLEKK